MKKYKSNKQQKGSAKTKASSVKYDKSLKLMIKKKLKKTKINNVGNEKRYIAIDTLGIRKKIQIRGYYE